MPRYYSYRRCNPYRGVVQVVEVDAAEAHSFDGQTWHLRGDDGYGWVRPTGVWVEGKGLQAGAGRQDEALLAALAARPALPFPPADSLELWLLDKAGGLPLALLDTRLPSRGPAERFDSQWYPFVPTYLGFRSPSLAARPGDAGQPAEHRDYLARLVNHAARPLPAAQWFRRHRDGSGEGLDGERLQPGWAGRVLSAAAFPDLLVRADWNNLLEQSVIKDYHAWLAALLLPWPDLSDASRRWLEAAACRRPRQLARIYRLLPRRLDEPGLQAALVAARLEASAGGEAAPDDLY